jgi:hypothetical protein
LRRKIAQRRENTKKNDQKLFHNITDLEHYDVTI